MINTALLSIPCSKENLSTMETVYSKLVAILIDMYTANIDPNRGYLLNSHALGKSFELVGDGLPSDYYFKCIVSIVLSPKPEEYNKIRIVYDERGIGNYILKDMLRVIDNYEL